MSNNVNLHPDFQSIKGRKISLKRWPLALMNGLLGAANTLYRFKYRAVVSHKRIVGSDGPRIPLLIIRPENLRASSPALVYYAGGAFVLRPSPRHIDYAVRYARDAHCLVVLVDYRTAPKHPFPAGFDDCHAALRWIFSHADTLGVDDELIAVGGDSAGGTMAASVAQKAAHEDGLKLCGQLLFYPATDDSLRWPSIEAYANVPPFREFSYRAVWETYLGHPLAAGAPRYAAPLHGELSGLAPAYVETAEFCPLRDEGTAYAQALAAKGVDVTLNATRGTVHGFDLLAAASSISKAAIESRVQFLRKIFRSEGDAALRPTS